LGVTSGFKPPRTPWPDGFPDVVLHAAQSAVLQHERYQAAKAGDAAAALDLVDKQLSIAALQRIVTLIGDRKPILVSAHAEESNGINAIPEAMATLMASRLGLPVAIGVMQINKVGHTRAKGFHRLAHQAAFAGQIDAGRQGGTLANLKGHIETNGGTVVCATALTGRPDSAVLALHEDKLMALRSTHGRSLEDWWRAEFGHGFDELTNSEARYLERSADVDTIRARIAAAQAI
jgi:hypothetical protein